MNLCVQGHRYTIKIIIFVGNNRLGIEDLAGCLAKPDTFDEPDHPAENKCGNPHPTSIANL